MLSKWLYKNDHVISHTLYDAKDLGHSYRQYSKDVVALYLETRSNKLISIHEEMVFFPAFYKEQKSGFAVETFAYEKGEKPNHQWCFEKSNDTAKSKIHSCYGKMALRPMTQDESELMQAFENETNGKRFSTAIAIES